MNQHLIPIQVEARINELRELNLEAKLLRQAGRVHTAEVLEAEAEAHRATSEGMLANWQKLGLLPSPLPDFIKKSFFIPEKA